MTIGSNTLTINGTLSGTGSLGGGASSNLIIGGGSGALGSNLTFSGSTQVNNFTINRPSSGSVALGSNLTVLGTFANTQGTLALNGNTLRLSGPFTSGGSVTGSATSTLIVDGAGALASMTVDGGALNTFTLDRPGSTFVTNSTISISNLNLNNGIFDNSLAAISISSGGTISRDVNGSILATPTGTSYNVVYVNASAFASGGTGPELPVSSTLLNNLTMQGGGIVTLNNAITVNGNLTLTSGNFVAGSNGIDLKGNLISNATSSLTSSSFTFSGNTTVSGAQQVTFGSITVTGTLTPTSALQINGNLVNNGTLNSGSGTVTFGGSTTISGTSVCAFNNVVINSGSSLTASASTNLNVAGNWTNNGTFTHSSGTVTFNGTTSFSGTGLFNFGAVTITGTVNAPTSLGVARDFTNNGAFVRGSGTVLFNGTSTQSIAGSSTTTFNNINVTNTAGPPAVRVETNQNLAGVLTLSANSQFDADGSSNTSVFTLLSSGDSPTVDAAIATLPAGASVTGNVTVQRHMAIEGANNNRIYRYVSSPVQSAPVSQIQTAIPVTGGFTGSSTCSGCTAAQSMFAFDETLTNGNLSAGYINFPAASNSETLTTGRGYAMFVRGNVDPISSSGNARWAVRGAINSGTINFNAFTTFTVDGWNLIGNPYPSTIDWDAAGWTRTNVDNATYMLDNGLATPVHATYVNGTQANGGSRYISTGQAFFVRTSSAGVNLQATESVKVAGTQTTFLRKETVQNELRLVLSKSGLRDEAVIRLKEGSTENFDPNYDAVKFKNGTPSSPVISLSSFSADNNDLVINTIGTKFCTGISNTRVIPLNIDRVVPGTHTLSFSQLDTFSEDLTFVLRDLFTKDSLILTPSSSSYQFSVTPDAKSYGSGRFVLACNCNGRITETKEPGSNDLRVYPNPTESSITVELPFSNDPVVASVYDNVGAWIGDFKLNKAGELLTGDFDMSGNASGMYFVRVSSKGKVLTKKVIKK